MINLKKISLLLIFSPGLVTPYSIDGTLDRSYAKGQQMSAELPVCKAVAMQADGKMLVAGYIEMPGKKMFAIARLLPNGMLDQSFGKNGVVQTNFTNGETASSAQAIMIDSQCKIVAAGFTNGINNLCHACLARYNSDGSLDKTFFGGRGIYKGTVVTTFGSVEQMSQINALAETNDHHIVAVGSVYENRRATFAIAKYTPHGSLDMNFGTDQNGCKGGIIYTQFDSSTHDEAFAVTIDSFDKILVAGSSHATGIKTFALARYHKDGSLDQSFFGGSTSLRGTVITNFMCGETEGVARAVRVQADGKIVAAGYTNALCPKGTQFALARYTAQGMLDKSFNTDNNTMSIPGTIVTHFGDAYACAAINALLLQADGKIIAGGYAQVNNQKYFALARYECNGACDYTFNGGDTPQGTVLSRSSSQNNDEIFGLAFALFGDIIAVGKSKSKTMSCGAVARYMCEQNLECPEIIMPRDEQIIVNGAAIGIKGSCKKTSKLQIYLDNKIIDTLHARGCDHWEYTLPPLPTGPHYVQVCERYDAGNIVLQSKKIKIVVDQHPCAINQTMECQGMRSQSGILSARGASGDYIYRIIKENNCRVTLENNSSFNVCATIPCGEASFDFEVIDNVTGCSSIGSVDLLVREIPVISDIQFNACQEQKIEANLVSYTMGGQKPYSFQFLNNNNNDGICELKSGDIFSFSSHPEFVGATDFLLTATDSYHITSDVGHLLIKVYPVPKAPECTLHSYSNMMVTGQMMSHAYDGLEPYLFSLNSVQHNCSVSMQPDGSFVCLPSNNASDICSFEYIITDARGYESKPCKVTIHLHEPMVIADGYFMGIKNKKIKEDLTKLISHGSPPYYFEIKDDSKDGSVILNEDGSFEFIPHKGFVGTTKFVIAAHDANAYEGHAQEITIALTFKPMSDFDTITIDLYEDMRLGDLNIVSQKTGTGKFELVFAPEGLSIELHPDGTFNFDVINGYDEPIEFMYQRKDELGNASAMLHAAIVLHKYPIAHSVAQEIEVGKTISGNLNELMSEGFAPFSYKIISASNGKIVCQPDGFYTFKPRFDLVGKAEFAYRATDVNNHTSNVAKVEFNWPFQDTHQVQLSLINNETVECNQMEIPEVQTLAMQENPPKPDQTLRRHKFIRSINK